MDAVTERVRALQDDVRAAAASPFSREGKRTHDHQACIHDVAKLLGQSRGVRELALPDDPVLVARVFSAWNFSSGLKNNLYSDDQDCIAVQETDADHEHFVEAESADHPGPPTVQKKKKAAGDTIHSQDGITSSFTKCLRSVARARRPP